LIFLVEEEKKGIKGRKGRKGINVLF